MACRASAGPSDAAAGRDLDRGGVVATVHASRGCACRSHRGAVRGRQRRGREAGPPVAVPPAKPPVRPTPTRPPHSDGARFHAPLPGTRGVGGPANTSRNPVEATSAQGRESGTTTRPGPGSVLGGQGHDQQDGVAQGRRRETDRDRRAQAGLLVAHRKHPAGRHLQDIAGGECVSGHLGRLPPRNPGQRSSARAGRRPPGAPVVGRQLATDVGIEPGAVLGRAAGAERVLVPFLGWGGAPCLHGRGRAACGPTRGQRRRPAGTRRRARCREAPPCGWARDPARTSARSTAAA